MSTTFAAGVALLAAGALSALEWRRTDRRNLAARLGATFLAVSALAALGWRPAWRHPAAPAHARVEAALWTPGAAAGDGRGVGQRFALPGATAAPPDAAVLPDAATLRRRFPAVGTLHVYGDGLEPFDLDALRGMRVVFHPTPMQWPDPAFSFVRCPRELPPGEPLVVQGRVSGLTPKTTATVTLEAPDGARTDMQTFPADAAGDAGFSLVSAPPPAAGRFLWRLRLGKNDEPLGVAVLAPELPRVLVLAGAPRFDTAALRRWFQGAGGTLAARTLVGQERYRFESAHDPPPQLTRIDAPLLAGFDLVLADGRALAALPPPERDALQTAVADNGLGLLVLADDATLPDAPGVPPETRAAFFPWKLVPLGDASEGDRLTRVQWPGQARAIEIPVPSAPFEIGAADGQMPLVRDGQNHTLAASVACGRGQIALTLVRDTGRWTRENDPAAFAAYWSALFSTLARKTTAMDGGRWTLTDGEAGPVFVDQPVELVWSGPPSATALPVAGVVTAGQGTDPGGVTLPLARDPDEPGRARGTFWPRRSGWQRVTTAGIGGGGMGGSMDFFVDPAGDWLALAAARRRAATKRFAEGSAVAAIPPAPTTEAEKASVPSAWGFALFLAGAGYLWIERRLKFSRT